MTSTFPSLYIEQSLLTLGHLQAGQTLRLTTNQVVMGRVETNDLVLPHHEISRQHAQLMARGERYYLIDLESTNGTFVNSQRLTPHTPQVLKDGDLIELSDVIQLRFGDPGVTLRKSAPRPSVPLGIWLDRKERLVYLQRRPLDKPLPPTEFHLLALLLDHTGQVVTREQIANTLWPDAHGGVTEAMIDNTVARLRRYLAAVDTTHEYVQTMRGVGYRLVQPVAASGTSSAV